MLGMLSFPSRLAGVAVDGLLVALALTFVARPLAVALSTLPFGFNLRETIFLSWVGLKGAVPITLATFPLLAGVEHGTLIFNVVFFVVLVSAVTQGWSLPLVARWLRLGTRSVSTAPVSVEINALRHVDGEIVEYLVAPDANVAERTLRELALPYEVTVTLVVRGNEVIMPRGRTVLAPGDRVFVAMRRRIKPLMDCLFDACADPVLLAPGQEIVFRADHTAGQLCGFFSLACPRDRQQTLGELLAETAGQPVRLGPFLVTPGEDDGLATLVFAPETPTPASFPAGRASVSGD